MLASCECSHPAFNASAHPIRESLVCTSVRAQMYGVRNDQLRKTNHPMPSLQEVHLSSMISRPFASINSLPVHQSGSHTDTCFAGTRTRSILLPLPLPKELLAANITCPSPWSSFIANNVCSRQSPCSFRLRKEGLCATERPRGLVPHKEDPLSVVHAAWWLL